MSSMAALYGVDVKGVQRWQRQYNMVLEREASWRNEHLEGSRNRH